MNEGTRGASNGSARRQGSRAAVAKSLKALDSLLHAVGIQRHDLVEGSNRAVGRGPDARKRSMLLVTGELTVVEKRLLEAELGQASSVGGSVG